MTKPLRIGLIMQGGRGWIGGTEYIKNIIFALSSLPVEVRATFEVCLICSEPLSSDLEDQIKPHLKNIYYEKVSSEFPNFLNRVGKKLIRKLIKKDDSQFVALLKEINIDFIYPYFTKSSKNLPYRTCAWIYDFQHKYLPHLFSAQELEQRDKYFELIAQHSPTVVLSSKTAASDFQKFFPVSQCKTEVLQFRTSIPSKSYELPPIEIQNKYSLPERFFLVSNQFWQHKNHIVLFEALKLLRESSIYPVVVCTGHIYDSRKPDYSDTILQTIHLFGLAQQIYLLGLIPKIDQIQLMRRSLAVIQPSLFEGWSTVIEDARCFGKKMILSDFPVHLEQSPPDSVFFERHSPESLASLIADWWQDLSPGPNLEQETVAKTQNLDEVQQFGYRFLEIARGT